LVYLIRVSVSVLEDLVNTFLLSNSFKFDLYLVYGDYFNLIFNTQVYSCWRK